MIFAVAATAVCGVLLGFGPERRSVRAWVASAVMLLAMLAAFAGPMAQLLGGVVALAAAPLVVVRIPSASVMPGLHRALALLTTAGCLLGGFAGAGSSHHSLQLGPLLFVAYLVSVVAALAHERRRTGKLEVVVMAAGMAAMTLLG